MSPDFTIQFVANERLNVNGRLQPRVVLEIGGQQRLVQRVSLDSDSGIARVAGKWAEQFGIDRGAVRSALQELGVEAMAQVAEWRAKRKPDGKSDLRISDVADEFLQGLEPEWHKKHRTIYFQKLGREVALGSLWTLANDSVIDAVAGTVESHEAARGGPGPGYRTRLTLFEKAVAMAGARLLDKLPRVDDVAQDYTVDREVLLDRLIQWMLRERTFRADTGNPITLNYHQWAVELEPSDCWCRCFGAAVFGRIDTSDGRPRLAVKGQTISGDLKYESSRRLAADLRTAGFADIDRTIKVTRVTWRVWVLDPKIIDAVSGGNAE